MLGQPCCNRAFGEALLSCDQGRTEEWQLSMRLQLAVTCHRTFIQQ